MGKINSPFDVTYMITFSGKTISDGVPTSTAQMVRDKIFYVLEDCLAKGYIRDYKISAQRNNIQEAKKVIKKSKT